MTSWLTERQRDGDIDRIAVPDGVPGELRLCGKHAIGAGRFADPTMPWSTVVCLCERHELDDRYPDYVSWLDRQTPSGERAVWFPIHDLHAPPIDIALPLVDDLAGALRAGRDLLVHCGAGIGRAGTVATCVLIRLGCTIDDALAAIAAGRPGAGPEVGAQRELVDEVASQT